MRKSHLSIALAAAALLGTLLFAAPGLSVRQAHAVIGRPMTPVSYAGVARRTTRRVAYAGAATAGAYYGASAGAYYGGSAAYITALPSGCVNSPYSGTVYYNCGSTWYRPYYQGSTVVYTTVAAP